MLLTNHTNCCLLKIPIHMVRAHRNVYARPVARFIDGNNLLKSSLLCMAIGEFKCMNEFEVFVFIEGV
jgi:hypothetical protein